MASSIDVVADQPARRASNEYVGGEVLLAQHPCQADAGGQRVDPGLTPPGRIFGGQDGGGGPGENGMGRRKGRVDSCAALKEEAAGIIRLRSLPPRDKLHSLLHDKAIHKRFAGEDSSFASVFILFEVSNPIQGDGSSEQAADKNVGGSAVGVVEARVMGNDRGHDVVVGGDPNTSGSRQWDEPFQIVRAHSKGACPDCALILQDVNWKGLEADGLWIVGLRSWGVGQG